MTEDQMANCFSMLFMWVVSGIFASALACTLVGWKWEPEMVPIAMIVLGVLFVSWVRLNEIIGDE